MKNLFSNKLQNWSLLIRRGARTKTRFPTSREKQPPPPPEPKPKPVQEIISQHTKSSSSSSPLKNSNKVTTKEQDNYALDYSVHPDDSLEYTKYKV